MSALQLISGSLKPANSYLAETKDTFSFGSLKGRLVELSGLRHHSALTLCAGLFVECQKEGLWGAWFGQKQQGWFAEDLHTHGIDLRGLLIVRVPQKEVGRGAERLLRTGGVGCLVMDLGTQPLSFGTQSRLVRLATRHDAVVIALTEKTAHLQSLGPMVSIRTQVERVRSGTQFLLRAVPLRDKRMAANWVYGEHKDAPPGLY